MIFWANYYLGSVVETFWDGAGMVILYGGHEIEWWPHECGNTTYKVVCPD